MSGTQDSAVGAGGRKGKRLARSFLARDPVLVAPELLGKLLRRGPLLARIVEVEAYRGAVDAASHAFRGKTLRNATMFGPPGRLYVYFTYGMHYCANVVCWPEGEAGAVLLRALAPLRGLEEMAERRYGARGEVRADEASPEPIAPASGRLADEKTAPRRPQTAVAWRPEGLCSGPAKLCQAFGLDRSADGYDLISGAEGLALEDDGTPPPKRPSIGPRIGLAVSNPSRGEPWRWWVPDDPNVSRPRTR